MNEDVDALLGRDKTEQELEMEQLEAKARRAAAIEDLLLDVAERWPLLQIGEATLQVVYSRGRVRRAYVHSGPFPPSQLGALPE